MIQPPALETHVPLPVHHGPTWAKDDDGNFLLPELTLGWHILDWVRKNLLDDEGNPFKPSPEQARFLLWMYAIDARGRFVYREMVLQRLKGWGRPR